MPKRILVVEDDDNVGMLLQFLLEREGFQVTLVTDGRDALAAIKGKPPAIVLCDVMLPHADGHEIIQKIRSTKAWKSVPIVMLTAKSPTTDAPRALDAGPDDYVQKPFGPDELLARIRRHLRSGA